MQRSASATELERYNPDNNQLAVTANRPLTLKVIRAHRECLATPTRRIAHNDSNTARAAKVVGQRMDSQYSKSCYEIIFII